MGLAVGRDNSGTDNEVKVSPSTISTSNFFFSPD